MRRIEMTQDQWAIIAIALIVVAFAACAWHNPRRKP